MEAEIWVVVAAVFVSGGAIGSVGTLLAQWLLRKIDAGPAPHRSFDVAEREALTREITELHRHVRNLDARLDFTEQLLDGALPMSPPPSRLPAPEPPTDAAGRDEDPDERSG